MAENNALPSIYRSVACGFLLPYSLEFIINTRKLTIGKLKIFQKNKNKMFWRYGGEGATHKIWHTCTKYQLSQMTPQSRKAVFSCKQNISKQHYRIFSKHVIY